MDLVIKNCKFYFGQIVYLTGRGKGKLEYEVRSMSINMGDITSLVLKDLNPYGTDGYVITLYKEDFDQIYFSKEEAEKSIK